MIKLKNLFIILAFLILSFEHCDGQAPAYYFSQSLDTAIESNGYIIAGYVKSNTAPTTDDSVVITLKSGSPLPNHMDTASRYVINFSAGQDSAPFNIHIMKDTFPEYPEYVLYVLNSPVNGSTIDIDSTLLFVLIDTTPRATISFVIDTGSAYLHDGTFTVCMNTYNPNPFYIRYQTRTYDAWNYPGQTAYGGYDYYYTWETIYAPPGLSTFCEDITIVADTSLNPPSKKFICAIENVSNDDNIITDSFFYFTIWNDNKYDSPTVSFGTSALIIKPDSSLLIGIPISVINPNHLPLAFMVDTGAFSSNFIFDTLAFSHFNFTVNTFSSTTGIRTDTLWLNIFKPKVVSDTAHITLLIKGVRLNKSTDTIFNLTIINPDTVPFISFLGAGLAHLKSDSVGYVKLTMSSIVKYPVSVKVSYINGNAIPYTDFIFNDTTITFSAFTSDTMTVPVIMLQDHLYQGNTQVNLQLTDVNPPKVQYLINQYTYTIIDDEDSGLAPLNIQKIGNDQTLTVYPNPFDNDISIQTSIQKYNIVIRDAIGQEIYDSKNKMGNITIDLADRPSGLYLITLTAGDKTYVRKIVKF